MALQDALVDQGVETHRTGCQGADHIGSLETDQGKNTRPQSLLMRWH